MSNFSKKGMITLVLLIAVTGFLVLQGNQTTKTELVVSAAASLTDVLQEVQTSFTAAHSDIEISYNFGSSGKLAAQIEQGAPADIFISASKKDMDSLDEKQRIQKESRQNIASNEIVLIAPQKSPLSLADFTALDLEKTHQIAIGNPESVPAGRYAKEIFQQLNQWDQLEKKLVFSNDVRQVLTYVETGNVELGVVYATDVSRSNKVKVLARAKAEWHKPIEYPAVIVTQTKYPEQAKEFLTYLTSAEAKSIFEKYGFITK